MEIIRRIEPGTGAAFAAIVIAALVALSAIVHFGAQVGQATWSLAAYPPRPFIERSPQLVEAGVGSYDGCNFRTTVIEVTSVPQVLISWVDMTTLRLCSQPVPPPRRSA